MNKINLKSKDIVGGENVSVYSTKRLKQKLIDKYGDHVYFAEVCGRRNVVCFKDLTSYIVNQKWYSDTGVDSCAKTEKIVKTATKLIIAQIREIPFDKEHYPSFSASTDSFNLPSLLLMFCQVWFHLSSSKQAWLKPLYRLLGLVLTFHLCYWDLH
jgi:hypothetical protein